MIAIMCALRQEIRPLLGCINVSMESEIDDVLFYQGDLNGQPLTIVQGGVGRENAIKATRCLLESAKVDLIISSGVAGRIRQGLNIGELVVADRDAYSKQSNFDVEKLQLESDYVCNQKVVQLSRQLSGDLELKLLIGNILTVDKIINKASTKRNIGDHNSFLAVEMEGAAVAEVAFEKEVAFAAIRSISDDIDDDLHLDYDNIISDEGKVKVAGIALEVLKNPKKLAALKRLNKQTKKAAKSLAYFMPKLISLIKM